MSSVLWALLVGAVVAEVLLTRSPWRRRLRGLVPWLTGVGRALLALAAVGASDGDAALIAVLAVLAGTRLGSASAMAVLRPRMRQLVFGAGIAQAHFAQFRWADYSSRPFDRVLALFTGTSVVLDLVMGIAGLANSGWVAAIATVAMALGLVEVATHGAGLLLWNRRQEISVEVLGQSLDEIRPRVVLYTAALPESVGNLEQWLPALEESGEKAYVISREPDTVERLARISSLPIVYLKALGGLERLLPTSVEIALYVDTSTRNNHLLRIDRLVHVQLHHGDSDKASSSSRLLRLYDRHLVAGRAAVDRLLAAGVIDDPGAAIPIGRPLASRLATAPAPPQGRPTVLYAPTWEGYHEDNRVSSVPIGSQIAQRLIATDSVDLVVRPHPLTGRVDKRFAAAKKELTDLARDAPRAAVSADTSAGAAIDALAAADVLITDVSGMLSDFLYSGRPILVVDVADLGAEGMLATYPTVGAAYVVSADLSDLPTKLDLALGPDPLAARRAVVAARTLGDFDGAGTTFAEALASLGR